MADDWLGITNANLYRLCGAESGYELDFGLNGDGCWRHNVDEEHWFILDLGATYTIKKMRGRSNTHGYDPTMVDVFVSDDMGDWGDAVAIDIDAWQDTVDWKEVDTTDKDGRYIKVVIKDTQEPLNWIGWGDEKSPFTIFDAYGSIAGGQQLTYSASDTMAISDSASAAARYNVSIADSLSIGDSLTGAVMTFRQAIADTMAISDSIAGGAVMTFRQSIADNMAISDAVTKVEATYRVALADTLAISDSIAGGVIMTFRQALADAMTISDAISAAAAYHIAIADNLSISDTISAAATYAVALADTMDISDAIATGWKFYVALADTMDISDTMTYEAFVGEVKKRMAAAMPRKMGWPTPINVGMGA